MSSKYFERRRANRIPKEEFIKYYGPVMKSYEVAEVDEND